MTDFMELSNVQAALPWGAWEPLALFFLAAGAAAGLLAALAALLGRDVRQVRVCGIAALTSGLVGQTCLLMGLEQPLRAYEFYLRPHFTSWTAWGAYIIPLFLLACLLLLWQSRKRRVPLWSALAALVAAAFVFLYASREILESVGRVLWITPLLPVAFVVAGLAAACGFVAMLSPRPGSATPLPSAAVTGAFLCAALAALFRAPQGYAAYATVWWNAPALTALAAAFLALGCLRLFRLPRVAAGLACVSAFMVFWKVIHMGQAFDRSASTFSDAAAWLDIISPASLLALAGGAGLWLAAAVILSMAFPPAAAGSRPA